LVILNQQNSYLHKKTSRNSENGRSISNIKLYYDKENSKSQKHLILVTQNKVLSIPAQTCHLKLEESKCNNLINPYCKWSNIHSKCISSSDEMSDILLNKTEKSFSNPIQNTTKNLVNLFNNKQFESSTLTAILFKNNDDYSNKYRIQNNEITISMNLIVFSIMIVLFVVFSFMIGALFTFHFYRKFIISKKKHIEKSS
jgi:hypothetical protein